MEHRLHRLNMGGANELALSGSLLKLAVTKQNEALATKASTETPWYEVHYFPYSADHAMWINDQNYGDYMVPRTHLVEPKNPQNDEYTTVMYLPEDQFLRKTITARYAQQSAFAVSLGGKAWPKLEESSKDYIISHFKAERDNDMEVPTKPSQARGISPVYTHHDESPFIKDSDAEEDHPYLTFLKSIDLSELVSHYGVLNRAVEDIHRVIHEKWLATSSCGLSLTHRHFRRASIVIYTVMMVTGWGDNALAPKTFDQIIANAAPVLRDPILKAYAEGSQSIEENLSSILSGLRRGQGFNIYFFINGAAGLAIADENDFLENVGRINFLAPENDGFQNKTAMETVISEIHAWHNSKPGKRDAVTDHEFHQAMYLVDIMKAIKKSGFVPPVIDGKKPESYWAILHFLRYYGTGGIKMAAFIKDGFTDKPCILKPGMSQGVYSFFHYGPGGIPGNSNELSVRSSKEALAFKHNAAPKEDDLKHGNAVDALSTLLSTKHYDGSEEGVVEGKRDTSTFRVVGLFALQVMMEVRFSGNQVVGFGNRVLMCTDYDTIVAELLKDWVKINPNRNVPNDHEVRKVLFVAEVMMEAIDAGMKRGITYQELVRYMKENGLDRLERDINDQYSISYPKVTPLLLEKIAVSFKK